METTKYMKNILIIIGHYLPGYKDGGPVRSIKNLTDRLGDEYYFKILTRDRDAFDKQPYPGIAIRDWNKVGKSSVFYVEPDGMDEKTIATLAAESDMVYMCGCFNDYARAALKAYKKHLFAGKLVIASMGLFTPGAFRIRYMKKKTYMLMLQALGLLEQVEWSATSQEEVEDIKREAGKKAICHIAEDLPRISPVLSHRTDSKEGELKVIFLSRISRKKNLSYAAEILKNCSGKIVFDIYGNREDMEYWELCKQILAGLPKNITWTYKGEAEAENVLQTFAAYDVFLFPTLAENFGHVILEALSAGCIPVISDKTPWTKEKLHDAGAVIPLLEQKMFQEKIQQYIDMSREQLQKCLDESSEAARKYSPKEAEDAYRKIFDAS